MKACLIDGCPDPAGIPGTARGWCSAHYNRWRRTGDPTATLTELKPVASSTCSIEGCDAPRWARGWCGTHYRRWQTTGDVGPAERLTKRPAGRCSLPTCRRPATSGRTGYCNAHYQRFIKHGDPLAGGVTPKPGAFCAVRNCGRPHYARLLCATHWRLILSTPRERRIGRTIDGRCTAGQLIARVDYYAGRCWMCGLCATEIDHVKPLAAGGTNHPANLRPACSACNMAKHATWPFTMTRKAA